MWCTCVKSNFEKMRTTACEPLTLFPGGPLGAMGSLGCPCWGLLYGYVVESGNSPWR